MGVDCLFCRIISGEAKGDIIYQDNYVIAIKDLYPKAKVHILVIAKKHIDSLATITPVDLPIIQKMMQAAIQLAIDNNINQTGYRIAINNGPFAGQTLPHLHLHLLGGQSLGSFCQVQ